MTHAIDVMTLIDAHANDFRSYKKGTSLLRKSNRSQEQPRALEHLEDSHAWNTLTRLSQD